MHSMCILFNCLGRRQTWSELWLDEVGLLRCVPPRVCKVDAYALTSTLQNTAKTTANRTEPSDMGGE